MTTKTFDFRVSLEAKFFLWKLQLGLLLAGLVSICYFTASRLTEGRHHELMTPFDAAIPFIPLTWWIYFPGYILALFLAILTMRNSIIYQRIVLAGALAQSICTVGFLILPSTFPRPSEAGGGLTGEAIRWFWSIDPPNNTFPSMHVALILLTATGFWKERHPLRWLITALAIGVVIAVHTTKQHYILDTLGGMGVALLAYWLVFRSSLTKILKRPLFLGMRKAD